MNRATLQTLAAAFLVMALAAASLFLAGGCSEPRDVAIYDGGAIDAQTAHDSAAALDGRSSDPGDAADARRDRNAVDSSGIDGGDLQPARQQDAGADLGSAPRTCSVAVELERCGTTTVYRCRVVDDDPQLTRDLHVSGCNAPDGTACAPCCPDQPAFLCPGGVR